MPTYDYECQSCAHKFDAFHAMSDEPLAECPECGGPVRRLIGAGAGIIFKGSGFYSTDSRKKTSPTSASTDQSGEGTGKDKKSAEAASNGGGSSESGSDGSKSGATGSDSTSSSSTETKKSTSSDSSKSKAS